MDFLSAINQFFLVVQCFPWLLKYTEHYSDNHLIKVKSFAL